MQHEEVFNHPVVRVMMETIRVRAILSEAFARSRGDLGLSSLELAVLIAIAGAPTAPTVPQIGRATGHARQAIQKAANRLQALGLIRAISNPDHKRAGLLILTDAGRETASTMLSEGGRAADSLLAARDWADWEQLAVNLERLRRELQRLSAGGDE